MKYTAVISAAPGKVVLFHGGTEQAMAAARDAGFDAVQLTARTPDDLPKELLRRLSGETGLAFSAVATGQVASVDGLTMNAGDEEKRKACVERIAAIAARAKEAGCPAFVIGMIRGNSEHAASQEESLRCFENSLREVSERFAEIGSTAFVEVYNHLETNMYYDPESVRRLIERLGSPRVRMSLDLMHLFIEGLDVPETIRRYAGYCYQIDITGEDRISPRESAMDFPAICRAIRDSGFDGYLNFEYSAQTPAAELSYIRELLERD